MKFSVVAESYWLSTRKRSAPLRLSQRDVKATAAVPLLQMGFNRDVILIIDGEPEVVF